MRTLYVALTRARERLVICGSWPERPPPEPDRARSHVELLQRRQGGVPDLPARYREQAQSHGPLEGSPLWHFPALALDAQKSEKVGHPLAARLASRAQVERDARTLAALRPAAEQRMSRPFRAGATSEAPEAHRARREGSGAGDRSFAAAVGSAIHQILEHFDPAAEAAVENERQRRELPHRLETLLEPDQLDAALVRGRELLARLQEGPLLERLRALGPDVARELPVLAPAAGEAGPVGCMAGVIDLLYRDPDDGGWVVADYKTDRARDENEIAGLLERYAPQGAVYARAVQDALGLPDPPRFELWLVDAGRVVPVPPVHWPAP